MWWMDFYCGCFKYLIKWHEIINCDVRISRSFMRLDPMEISFVHRQTIRELYMDLYRGCSLVFTISKISAWPLSIRIRHGGLFEASGSWVSMGRKVYFIIGLNTL